MMEPYLVILAGGVSSRMKQGGDAGLSPKLAAEAAAGAKTLLSIGSRDRPFLDYLLFNAREAGYRDIVLVVGEEQEPFHARYGAKENGNEFHGLRISYALQPIPNGRKRPLGTADALERALRSKPEWNGAHVTVCNSDNLYSIRALRMLREEPTGTALIDYDRSALRFPPERVAQFGILVKDDADVLTDILEKPTVGEMERARDRNGRIGVSMNVWRFPVDRILPCLESVPLHPVRQEKELPAAALMFIRRWPGSLRALPLAEHVIDLTSRADIGEVRITLAREFPEELFRQT